jgi:hypothetical protein
MRKTCEDFFAARLPLPGLAACAARLPDGMVIQQCFSRWLTADQVRQAVAQLALAAEALQQHQIAPIRMGWLFEHLRVVLRSRPDQACMVLFLENRPELPVTEAESVLEEFAALPMAPQG